MALKRFRLNCHSTNIHAAKLIVHVVAKSKDEALARLKATGRTCHRIQEVPMEVPVLGAGLNWRIYKYHS